MTRENVARRVTAIVQFAFLVAVARLASALEIVPSVTFTVVDIARIEVRHRSPPVARSLQKN
jgi:hypothetical protein